ncbi:MraY family glycosyltransferase [Elusimicrobiota bacterium]
MNTYDWSQPSGGAVTYIVLMLLAFVLSATLTPLISRIAQRFNLFDLPDPRLKSHKRPIPRLGGTAIFMSIIITLVIVRLFTHYPTGTIHNFRFILIGAMIVFCLGFIDDIKKGGVPIAWKFIIQSIAAGILVWANVRIHFVSPEYFAMLVSFIWIIGITNAINLIDVIDGIAGTQIAIASLAFLAIGFPSEAIYVNILASAAIGGSLGFLPYNLTNKFKIFMGDGGSLVLGYLLATMSLGCSYTSNNPYAVFAPLFILAIPIFETFFLIYIRLRQGKSPVKGSKDHVAHRLQTYGFTPRKILFAMASVAIVLSILSWIVTLISNEVIVILIYAAVIAELVLFAKYLSKLKSVK